MRPQLQLVYNRLLDSIIYFVHNTLTLWVFFHRLDLMINHYTEVIVSPKNLWRVRLLFGLFYTSFCFAQAVFIQIELFIIYWFRFAFIAPGISPLDSFGLQKNVIQKFGVNIHNISIRAIIKELSTHFTEDKLIIYLVHRLPILRSSNVRTFDSKERPFWSGKWANQMPPTAPLGICDWQAEHLSLPFNLQVRFVFNIACQSH